MRIKNHRRWTVLIKHQNAMVSGHWNALFARSYFSHFLSPFHCVQHWLIYLLSLQIGMFWSDHAISKKALWLSSDQMKLSFHLCYQHHTIFAIKMAVIFKIITFLRKQISLISLWEFILFTFYYQALSSHVGAI